MNIKETLTELLPNVEVSDEFVTKLTASIETAITKRVVEETKAISDKLEEQKRNIAESIRIQKMLDSIVLAKTKMKKARLDEIKKIAADLYISAKQAKDFGIVHEIF